MASQSNRSAVVSQSEVLSESPSIATQPVLCLRLHETKKDKKVDWSEDTVDNEHMGRRKSKCCCVYKKPSVFGESSSDDDEECDNCFGHPEKRKRNLKKSFDEDQSDEAAEKN